MYYTNRWDTILICVCADIFDCAECADEADEWLFVISPVLVSYMNQNHVIAQHKCNWNTVAVPTTESTHTCMQTVVGLHFAATAAQFWCSYVLNSVNACTRTHVRSWKIYFHLKWDIRPIAVNIEQWTCISASSNLVMMMLLMLPYDIYSIKMGKINKPKWRWIEKRGNEWADKKQQHQRRHPKQ